MTNEIIKIYYETLPKKNNRIDWNKSINCCIAFQCIDIIGEFKIVQIDKEDNGITFIHLQYKDDVYPIRYQSFLKNQIKSIFYPYKFNYTIGQLIKDEKKDFIITELKTRINTYGRHVKVVSYHCNKCSYDGEMDECRIKETGCPCCGTNAYIVVPGINDIATTDPWMISFFQDSEKEAKLYTHGSFKKIYPVCPDCGKIKNHQMHISTIYRQHNIGCSCSDGVSYPEKFFISLLEQLQINYKWQLSKNDFEWCKSYRYDFYLTDYNYIVELNGEQHYKDISFMKNKSKPSQSEIDKSKKDNALPYINKYIEIDCSKSELEYIKTSIENSSLSEIFNLNMVNYNKCEEFACKNIIKEICEYYNENKPILIKDIAEKYKLSTITIRRYLRKGTNIGWCQYDSKEQMKSSGGSLRKYVEVYQNNKYIKSYHSLAELAKNAISDLGVKICTVTLREKCKQNKSYKGYTFKIK